MDLPNEIVLQILQYLEKPDLKQARLVSKNWSCCSAEFLFERIFISPHDLNLNVFTNICGHPLLQRCVKSLEYDAAYFSPDLISEDYFDSLWDEVYALIPDIDHDPELAFTSHDVEVNNYLALLRVYRALEDDPEESEECFKKAKVICSNYRFILEGYRDYISQAKFQEVSTNDGSFLETFVNGAQQCARLGDVNIRNEWVYFSSEYDSLKPDLDYSRRLQGSPLARSRGCFQVTPLEWYWGPLELPYGSNGSREYCLFVTALSRLERPLHAWRTHCPLPPTVFNSRDLASKECLHIAPKTFSRLTWLELHLASYGDDAFPVMYDDLIGLQKLLESMTVLRYLHLDLAEGYDATLPTFVPYSLVFPRKGEWPHLRALTIEHMSVSTQDLLSLIRLRMPPLYLLSLTDINLLDGCWEGIFEYLRVADRLQRFGLPEGCLHCGGVDYVSTERGSEEHSGFLQKTADYVTHWYLDPSVRHPRLPSDQPMERSLEFLEDVVNLCETSDGILVKRIREDVEFYRTERQNLIRLQETAVRASYKIDRHNEAVKTGDPTFLLSDELLIEYQEMVEHCKIAEQDLKKLISERKS